MTTLSALCRCGATKTVDALGRRTCVPCQGRRISEAAAARRVAGPKLHGPYRLCDKAGRVHGLFFGLGEVVDHCRKQFGEPYPPNGWKIRSAA